MVKFAPFSRRTLVKWGLISTGLSLFSKAGGSPLLATPPQVGGRAEEALYPGKNLPGGGQMEIRMRASANINDPDLLELAQRLEPYNPESWYSEWNRIAEKNEQMAEQFEEEGREVTAHEFYLRSADFYERSFVYLSEDDPRMLPAYNKMRELFDKAGQLVRPPFERVEIPYEGKTLSGYFTKPSGGGPGQRFPTVFAYGGADTTCETSVIRGGDRPYLARGMAYLALDSPGQGGSLRLKQLYAPPDSERVAKAVFDYLVSRPDVDPNRIGIYGISLGGYSAPRCATGEKRVKAVFVWSAAYSLLEDIFDYYPPIQERIRWLIGAKDLADARKKIAEFTLEGRAHLIECPMLIGYTKTDRIMDPQGALRLYQGATRSQREMVEGTGHGERRFRSDLIFADWAAKQLAGTS